MIQGWLAVAEDAMQELIAQGQRPTPRRFAVVCQLAAHDEGMTFAELFAGVRRELPMVTSGTLQRNLASLVSLGIVVAGEGRYILCRFRADAGTRRNGEARSGGGST